MDLKPEEELTLNNYKAHLASVLSDISVSGEKLSSLLTKIEDTEVVLESVQDRVFEALQLTDSETKKVDDVRTSLKEELGVHQLELAKLDEDIRLARVAKTQAQEYLSDALLATDKTLCDRETRLEDLSTKISEGFATLKDINSKISVENEEYLSSMEINLSLAENNLAKQKELDEILDSICEATEELESLKAQNQAERDAAGAPQEKLRKDAETLLIRERDLGILMSRFSVQWAKLYPNQDINI